MRSGATFIADPQTREIATLFKATYLTLLVALGQYYKFQDRPNVPFDGVDTPQALRALSVGLMTSVIRPLGQTVLPELPLGAAERRAGPCFEVYGAPSVPWDRRVVWKVLHERLTAEHRAAAATSAHHPAIASVVDALQTLAGTAEELTG